MELIERAHQAADGSHGGTGTPSALRRLPAAAVPFLLGALQRYGVLERTDWNSALEGGLLGRQQVDQIRRLAYEELLWLAADVLRRQQEHRSGRQLTPEAGCGGCVRTLARSPGDATTPARTAAHADQAFGVALPTALVHPSLTNPTPGLHTRRAPDPSPAGSSGLVILLQRLLV